MKDKTIVLLICLLVCFCVLGCYAEPNSAGVIRTGDELSVSLVEEQYYILGLDIAEEKIAAACPAEISLVCSGTLSEPQSSEFDGSFTIVSDLFTTPNKGNLTGLKKNEKWMLSAVYVVEDSEGQWGLDDVQYQIYSGNDIERDGVLIVILGHGDNAYYAVKGSDPEEALERYVKLWEEVFL